MRVLEISLLSLEESYDHRSHATMNENLSHPVLAHMLCMWPMKETGNKCLVFRSSQSFSRMGILHLSSAGVCGQPSRSSNIYIIPATPPHRRYPFNFNTRQFSAPFLPSKLLDKVLELSNIQLLVGASGIFFIYFLLQVILDPLRDVSWSRTTEVERYYMRKFAEVPSLSSSINLFPKQSVKSLMFLGFPPFHAVQHLAFTVSKPLHILTMKLFSR